MKDKKVQESPNKNVESPVKESATENGSAKDDEVKENGAAPEETEQNGDNKGYYFIHNLVKGYILL